MAITANQVTMLRIFLLPLPVYMLIYGDTLQWWVAFSIFVLLGATDFVDGAMARRDGITKLGSLLDPVADKIFVAAILLSMVAIGMFPAWVISALLTREFLMTAMRSSVARREAAIKTSKLGKLKTIVQMGGFGTIFLTLVVYKYFAFVSLLLAFPLLAVILFYAARLKWPPFWLIPVCLAFVSIALVAHFFGQDAVLMFQIYIIVAITWASAIDYIAGTFRLLKKSGIDSRDFIRIIWSLIFGLFVTPLVANFPIMVLPLLVSISLEFGLGGIDNMVVAERKTFCFWPFFLSSVAGLVYSLVLNASIYLQVPIDPFYVSLALAICSSITCGATFGRNVDLFRQV